MAEAVQELGVTVLGSGSRGNATVIHTAGEALLIDAGFSARELLRRLRQSHVDATLIRAVVVSHEHADHVRGLRAVAAELGVPIYANRGTASVLRHRDERLGPVTIFAAGDAFQLGAFNVHPFSIPHDAYDPVAFIVQARGRRVGVATDLGHASQLVMHQLRGCDALLIESNHDVAMLGNSQRPWSLKQRILGRHGHLSNEACMELLGAVLDARTRHVVMAHASEECNCYTLVTQLVSACLAKLGRPDVAAHVARQDEPLPTVWV